MKASQATREVQEKLRAEALDNYWEYVKKARLFEKKAANYERDAQRLYDIADSYAETVDFYEKLLDDEA